MKLKRTLLTVLCIILLAPLIVVAQDTEPVTYRWTGPTEGSPAVEFNAQYRLDSGDWFFFPVVPDTFLTWDFPRGVEHEVRVRGLNADGIAGVWSMASEVYRPPLTPPGACGRPIRDH